MDSLASRDAELVAVSKNFSKRASPSAQAVFHFD